MGEMQKYYFTYGSEGQPYSGGWTEIDAPNLSAAIDVFTSYHPSAGFLYCAAYYTEKEFKKTRMYTQKENLGHGAWEKISVWRAEA